MKKLSLLAVFLMIVSACAPATKEVYVPAAEPPPPSMESILTHLYNQDLGKWRAKMKAMIEEENKDIPERHLVIALKDFNRQETRETCMGAAWLYLEGKAGENGVLTGADHELFSRFVSRGLQGTDSKSMERIESICRFLKDEPICAQMRK